jgi:hypothetical protein
MGNKRFVRLEEENEKTTTTHTLTELIHLPLDIKSDNPSFLF